MVKYQNIDNGCLRECQGSLIAVLPGQEWKGEAQRYLKESKVYTGNDAYSGDRFCGNDGFSGPKPPDHAILFTVSGITAIADKKFRDFVRIVISTHLA